jgi:hypothetical protein
VSESESDDNILRAYRAASLPQVVLQDHDKGLIMGSSEFLGMCEVSVESLTLGVPVEDWYTLQVKSHTPIPQS